MFQEKISLKLSEHLVDLIDHDCLQFGILKQDRSPNRNAFLNRLFLSFQAWGDKTSEYSFAFSKIINDDEALVSVGFKPTRETSLLVQDLWIGLDSRIAGNRLPVKMDNDKECIGCQDSQSLGASYPATTFPQANR